MDAALDDRKERLGMVLVRERESGARGGEARSGICCCWGPPARNRFEPATHRASQRTLRSLASRAVACRSVPGITWIELHDHVGAQVALDLHHAPGVNARADPSMWLTKLDAVLARRCAALPSENTWKPPESVRIGPSQRHETVQAATSRARARRPVAGAGGTRWRGSSARPICAQVVGVERLHRRQRADRP